MRRILLGGLGLALGAFTPTAFAQQPAFPNTQPARAAKLGRPLAIPDSSTPGPTDPVITQAGLFRNSPVRPQTSYAPTGYGAPTPVFTQPPNSGTMPPTQMPPMGQSPSGSPNSPPMVTESRDPTNRIPTGTIVPSVMPDSYPCPEPALESPLFAPQSGLGRLGGLGNGRNWISAEVLLWWNRSTQVPPLVTTSSPQFNGIPGQGDTRVLLGGTFGDSFHVGGRVGGGHWFDDNQSQGFDWRLFWVAPATASYYASVPPYTILARPFFNVNPGVALPNLGFGPSAEVVAGPGVANGFVSATMMNTVWGAEANYRAALCGDVCSSSKLDFLLGYRYLDVRDELTITEGFTRIPNSTLVGTPAMRGLVSDRFRTDNQFHGGQIGLAGTLQRGRWSLDARTTVALGTVFQSADITGYQALQFANGAVQTTPGGLLTAPGANIGHWTQSRFAVVPEVGLNLGYQITPRMKVFVGYNFLFLSSALRPSGVIDPYIDAARVPNLLPPGTAAPVTPVHPSPQMNPTSYFIQGINFGLVYRW